MSSSGSRFTRRRFLSTSVKGAATIPLVSVLGSSASWAADMAKLDPSDPTAMALGYVHDANTVDTAKFPKRASAESKSQLCDNCMQYQPTADGWGTCAIFPAKLVAGPGWCNVWVAKPGA